MEIEPDQSTVGEVASDVEEVASPVESVAAPKKVRKTAAKAVPARKTASKPASRSKPKTKPRKRPEQAAKPVAPPPPPLTIQELKEQGAQAKQELVNAVIEPALEAAGSLSQTIRDTIGGAFAGLLSRKRRGD
jgi:hypothetical protein